MKQFARRAKKVSLGVITAIFVASFFMSALPAQSVFATAANDASTNPNDWMPRTRAARWAQLTGLYHCIQSAWSGSNSWADWSGSILTRNHNIISDAHASAGEWFWDPTGPMDRVNEAASYIDVKTNDSGNGKADCNIVTQAVMKTYSMSGAQLLCNLGAKRQDGSPCEGSVTGSSFTAPDSNARLDLSAIWGSKDLSSNAGGPAYYELDLAALMDSKGCGLKEQAGATGNFAYTLKIVDSSGNPVDTTYTGLSRDHKINVYTSYPGLNNQERSCATIASDLGKSSSDYSLWVQGHLETPPVAQNDGKTTTGSATTCAVDGVGWIICPIMTFMAKLNDSAFGFVQSFLVIRPALLTDTGTRNAWSAFRDIANVAFVIAFLVIVYSQLTSAGVSNYGIKKMLPRVVVAAILVNLSYYVCELAVDISNIVGSSVYSLFQNVPIGNTIKTGDWQDQTAGILAGAGVAGVGLILLVALLPAVPMALLAFVVIILILIARQALVILLVVMSPLAFVAYLLPNTENWFKKWWKAFSATLMVYPIIGVVFGASTLASKILNQVAGNETDSSLLQVVALGVLAVPLLAVPALLKGALSSAGSIGTKLASISDKASKRASRNAANHLGNRAERYKNRFNAASIGRSKGLVGGSGGALGIANSRRRRIAGAVVGLGATRAVNNEQKDKYAKASMEAASRNYVAERAISSDRYARSIAGGDPELASLAKAYSIEAVEHERKKDRDAQKTILVHENVDFKTLGADIQSGAYKGNTAKEEAALERYFELANSDGVQEMISHIGDTSLEGDGDAKSINRAEELRKIAATSLTGHPLKPVDLSASNLSRLKNGDSIAGEGERISVTVGEGKTTASHIAKMDIDEMRRWNKQMENNPDLFGDTSQEVIAATRKAIEAAESDPRLNVNFGDREKKALEEMRTRLHVAESIAAKKSQDAAAATYGPTI